MKLKTFLLMCALTASSHVQSQTLVGPTPSVTTSQDYELPSGAPADDYLWTEDYPGQQGYGPSYGFYVCSYPNDGQTCTHQNSGSTISLTLTEKRSGMKHQIKIQGYQEAFYNDPNNPDAATSCAGKRPLNSQYNWTCGGSSSSFSTNTKALTVWIPQSEMNNLPVGGVWEGKLKLKFTSYSGGTPVNYTANITLKGKTIGKQDIYFPEFNGANPLVQLDLHPTGSVTGNSFVEDVTTLDMCLYDGFNSNSDSMRLSFKDEGRAGAGRKEGYFSIYNTASAATEDSKRIDYRLEMFDPHSKGWMSVKNNDAFTLSAGTNGQDQIRPVRLPSINYPVLCAPAPLRLIVDKFRVADKTAGYYKGILTVEFSPSLNSL